MAFESFITWRIARSKGQAFSALIVRIATVAIALSLAVMIVASSLIRGFQETITDKVYGFLGHVIVQPIDTRREGRGYDDVPVSVDQAFYRTLAGDPEVRHVQVFARKAGILKSRRDIEGVIVRGIDADFDWDFFGRYLVEGAPLRLEGGPSAEGQNPDDRPSDGIVISRSTQRRMGFGVGDELAIFFIDQTEGGTLRQRARTFTVRGIYHTGLEEYDRLFCLVDIDHIRRINGWTDSEVGGFEVHLARNPERPEDLRAAAETVDARVGPFLRVNSLRDLEPNLFDWLSLQGQNEGIIMTLMLLVAIINMVTSLLILILERTPTIGVLKALGATDWSVRRIFLGHAAWIIGIGLLWGNLLGLGLCWAQDAFGLIRLPEESYYVTVAPVSVSWAKVLGLNALTLAVCVTFLLLPSWLVTRIDPIRALRFD
jgi:lipoprotein-releasing system permease protein